MEDASAAARGRENRRGSHFDDQRASLRSSLQSHSRPNSPEGLSEHNASSSVAATAHGSLTPLQEAAARHGSSPADSRRSKHRSNIGDASASQPSKHHNGISDVTRKGKHHSDASDATHHSKQPHASRQWSPEVSRKPSQSPEKYRKHSQSPKKYRKPSRPSPVDEYTLPADYDNLDDAAAPPPVVRSGQRRLWQPDSLEEEFGPSSRGRSIGDGAFQHAQDLTELSALPPVVPRSRDRSAKSRSSKPSRHGKSSHAGSNGSSSSRNNPRPITRSTTGQQPKRASMFATQLYTISYMILFSILGTLARLGLQWLTFYPGAPVIFSELWANVGGSLVMGFLAEDRNLFREEWGTPAFFPAIRSRSGDEEMAKMMTEAKTAHGRVKKTIPLYIGLATGFCGSFTSFSSFMRDIFLALSNDMPSPINHPYPSGAPRPEYGSTVSRNGGYSFMAIIAVIVITSGLCLAAYIFGGHLALALDPITPTLPFRLTRRILDRVIVPIAWFAWLGAIFMTIWPPDRPAGPLAPSSNSWDAETWRGQALFACVFAPAGALLRFYASLKLNGLMPSFPLGTFAVNIFGTAVLGMAYDLQHVPLDSAAGLMGGGRLGCQVLEGLMDGFCGCLTTVSTWVAELRSLRLKHAYTYGLASVSVGLGVLVVVMGSVKWTIGFGPAACETTRWS